MALKNKLGRIKRAFSSTKSHRSLQSMSTDHVTVTPSSESVSQGSPKSFDIRALHQAKVQAFENALQYAIIVQRPTLLSRLPNTPDDEVDCRPYGNDPTWRRLLTHKSAPMSQKFYGMPPLPGDLFIVSNSVLQERRQGLSCTFLAGEAVAFVDLVEDDENFWLVKAYRRIGKIRSRNLLQVECPDGQEYPNISNLDSTPEPGSTDEIHDQAKPNAEAVEQGSHSSPGQSHISSEGLFGSQSPIGEHGETTEAKDPKPSPPSPVPAPDPPSPDSIPPPSPAPPVPEKSTKRLAFIQGGQYIPRFAREAQEAQRPLPSWVFQRDDEGNDSVRAGKQRIDTPQDSPHPIRERAAISSAPLPMRGSPALLSRHASASDTRQVFLAAMLSQNESSRGELSSNESSDDRAKHIRQVNTPEAGRIKVLDPIGLLEESIGESVDGLEHLEQRISRLEISSECDHAQMEERFLRLAQSIELLREWYDGVCDTKQSGRGLEYLQ